MPSWKELRRFLEQDGWKPYNKGSDHDYFRKVMPDGTVRRTKVSRGSQEIGKGLWRRIRDKQLGVTQEYFNGKK